MAAEPVTAEQYPDLATFELTSERGGHGHFLGRVVDQDVRCGKCRTSGSATVYRGPQYGLAFDEPVTPFEVAPVELELTWCTGCGRTGMTLRNQDGSEHTGL
ncbi:hypothetical protein [Amycolatopsis sp. NBC_01480]|uniref:hypothetical protein n=1 Tax=Amycolatopsis sp. NBC_01480 TaxID=2903562 RepID=UPI002E296E02|nr:hypothetical protein [Amycolatopsis sp. NBC_01480]